MTRSLVSVCLSALRFAMHQRQSLKYRWLCFNRQYVLNLEYHKISIIIITKDLLSQVVALKQ